MRLIHIWLPPHTFCSPQEENHQNTSMTIIRHNILSLKEVCHDFSMKLSQKMSEKWYFQDIYVRKVVFPTFQYVRKVAFPKNYIPENQHYIRTMSEKQYFHDTSMSEKQHFTGTVFAFFYLHDICSKSTSSTLLHCQKSGKSRYYYHS